MADWLSDLRDAWFPGPVVLFMGDQYLHVSRDIHSHEFAGLGWPRETSGFGWKTESKNHIDFCITMSGNMLDNAFVADFFI